MTGSAALMIAWTGEQRALLESVLVEDMAGAGLRRGLRAWAMAG